MSTTLPEILFHSPLEGVVDRANGVIRGVSLITGNLVAEGHGLEVDKKTVNQILLCARKAKKVSVKLDHGSGIKDTCGYLANFSIEGNKVRGDWHLLKSHAEYEATMERAERMPECFGLSVAFQGKGEKDGAGKEFARCEKLLAVDCVTRPAANPDGLFSAGDDGGVDTAGNGMPANQTNPGTAEPTLRDLMSRLDTVISQNEALQARIDALEEGGPEGDEEGLTYEDLEQLNGMTDEQLAKIGLTRSEVDAAVDAANALDGEGEGEAAEDGDGDGGDGGEEGVAAPAGDGGYAAGTVGAALSAMDRRVRKFEQRQVAEAQRREDAAVQHSFQVVEAKTIALAAQNQELTELAATQEAEIETLRLALKTGTRPVQAGMEGVHRFSSINGEEHQFTQLVKTHELAGKSPAQAIRLAIKDNPAAHAEWVAALRGQRASGNS